MKQLVQTVTSLTVMKFYHFDSMFELAVSLYLNKTSEQMKLHVDLLSVILALQQVCFLGGWGYGGNFLTDDFENATSNSLPNCWTL